MTETRTDDQFRLSGAWNFRDVASARTVDGAIVRPGVLYRSSELSRLDEDGQRTLVELGVREVFDLRGTSEVERSGADNVPDGVVSSRVPFEDFAGETAPHEAPIRDEDSQIAYMMRAYSRFPELAGARIAIGRVIAAVAEGRGAVLVHCAAGKDRAGWTVATVLRAAGVLEEDILADYLRSNAGVEPLLAHVRATWTGDPSDRGEPTAAMLGVRADYYRHAVDTMEALHGSFENYLDALGVDQDLLVGLRSRLLIVPGST